MISAIVAEDRPHLDIVNGLLKFPLKTRRFVWRRRKSRVRTLSVVQLRRNRAEAPKGLLAQRPRGRTAPDDHFGSLT